MPSIFLCHSSIDKPFVKKFAYRLIQEGINVWIDEAEIKIGDSLIQKISECIETIDYVAAIISSNSVKSQWVQKELSLAMTKEIKGRRIVVLPLLIESCKIPFFLSDKLYADFRNSENFERECVKILRTIKISDKNGNNSRTSKVSLDQHVVLDDTNGTSGDAQSVGYRPISMIRPPEAYTGLRYVKFSKTFGFYSVILSILFLFNGIIFPNVFFILLGVLIFFSGIMRMLSADYFEDAYHHDQNLL